MAYLKKKSSCDPLISYFVNLIKIFQGLLVWYVIG